MGNTKVQIDQKEVSENVKTILQASTSDQGKAVQQSYKIIIETAKKFNNLYQKMISKITDYENDLKICIQEWYKIKGTLNNGYKNTNEYQIYLNKRKEIRNQHKWKNQLQPIIQQTYELAMQFQAQINAALKQSITTIYVWVGRKGIPETYAQYNMNNFLKSEVDRYGNVVMRYRNNVTELRKHGTKLENLLQKDNENFNYQQLLHAYKESSERFKTYKVKKGGASIVLWRNPGNGQKWHGALVSSLGSINEAYATILIKEYFNPSPAMEDYMEKFMSFVLNVSNISGTLHGDTKISIKDKNDEIIGTMQLAIKSKGATTLSIQQLYNISKNIINLKLNNFNAIIEYLKTEKKNNVSTRSILNRNLNDIIQSFADENVGSLVDSLVTKLK